MLDHLLDQLLLVHALVHLACAVWTLVTYPSPETAQTCKRAISFPASLPVTPRTPGKAPPTLGRINLSPVHHTSVDGIMVEVERLAKALAPMDLKGSKRRRTK